MQVRTLDSVEGTDRAVKGSTFVSRRLLLAKDKMGFSVHDTVLGAGTVTKMWYQNHLEAVYCIEGEGKLEDLQSGRTYDIRPGTLYALDQHDRHVLTATTALRMVCVFNPPLVGSELHDENGSYPLLSPAE